MNDKQIYRLILTKADRYVFNSLTKHEKEIAQLIKGVRVHGISLVMAAIVGFMLLQKVSECERRIEILEGKVFEKEFVEEYMSGDD